MLKTTLRTNTLDSLQMFAVAEHQLSGVLDTCLRDLCSIHNQVWMVHKNLLALFIRKSAFVSPFHFAPGSFYEHSLKSTMRCLLDAANLKIIVLRWCENLFRKAFSNISVPFQIPAFIHDEKFVIWVIEMHVSNGISACWVLGNYSSRKTVE